MMDEGKTSNSEGNNMKKFYAAGILAVLLSTTALADTSSMSTTATGMGVLENDYVRAGVNGTAGTFGSGGGTRPGLQYDSDGTGTFPGDSEQGDYLTPGSPFDGFSVMVDGTNYANNNGRSNAITGDGNGLTDGTNSLSWTGGVTSVFDITNTYSLGTTSEYIDITSSITMGTAADDVWFSRHIDPDAMPETGDTSATDNVLGYGAIPDSNVAFSEATVSRYALGLYSTDSNVDAGITGWTQDADSYTENSVDGDGSNTNSGDNTIGLSWHWTSVASGDILTASYAYIFGPSAFDAADTAVTGGAGGGADILTGDLEDVGSATDAAEGGSDPVITYSDPVVDTDLPVLTQSQTTHDASATATVQTIDRETTTIVTTPMEIITYTDGVETARTPTDSVAVTTVTDPGSFTGRIDQVATAQDVTSSALRTLNFDTVSGVGMNSTMNNGMDGSTKGFQAGAKKELENGATVGLGGARLTSSLTGNGDAIDTDTTAVAISVEKNNVELGIRHAMSDYEISRTIGDFANTGETSGTDTAVSLRYTADEGKIRPIFGYTRGKRTMDGYTEAGSIQSARTVAESSEMYGYATIGGSVDVGALNITALHHTDGVNDVIIGIEKETEKVTFNLSAQRSMTDLGNTNSVFAGVQIKF
jgi:hypothetical protein